MCQTICDVTSSNFLGRVWAERVGQGEVGWYIHPKGENNMAGVGLAEKNPSVGSLYKWSWKWRWQLPTTRIYYVWTSRDSWLQRSSFKRVHCTTHCLRLYLGNSAILKYSTRASPPIYTSCLFVRVLRNHSQWIQLGAVWSRVMVTLLSNYYSILSVSVIIPLFAMTFSPLLSRFVCLFSLTWQYMCMVLYCVCMYIPTCTVAIWLLLWWASFRVWLIDWLIDCH